MSTALVSNPQQGGIWKDKFSFLFDAAPTGDTETYLYSCPAGILLDVKVKVGETPPNSLTVTVTDIDGVVLISGTLAADGILVPDNGPISFIGQLTVALTGNTTANAIGNCMVSSLY
jgi:hypothetical protein